MTERRQRADNEPLTGVLAAAVQQNVKQSAAERKKYGERLNTVTSMVCPTCHHTQRMTVHPGHRVYQLCGHAFELPPLPVDRTYAARRRSGTKPKGAAR